MGPERALDHHFDLATGGLDAEQACVDHSRVVENQQIAGGEQGGEIGKTKVDERSSDLQQTAVGAAV